MNRTPVTGGSLGMDLPVMSRCNGRHRCRPRFQTPGTGPRARLEVDQLETSVPRESPVEIDHSPEPQRPANHEALFGERVVGDCHRARGQPRIGRPWPDLHACERNPGLGVVVAVAAEDPILGVMPREVLRRYHFCLSGQLAARRRSVLGKSMTVVPPTAGLRRRSHGSTIVATTREGSVDRIGRNVVSCYAEERIGRRDTEATAEFVEPTFASWRGNSGALEGGGTTRSAV